MDNQHDPKPAQDPKLPQGSSSSKIYGEIGAGGHKYPNPPENVNPDAATLREQWKFAIRQYSKWYSHAWGTAILAGASFFALGWIIKGSNPLPSFQSNPEKKDTSDNSKTTPAASAEVSQAR